MGLAQLLKSLADLVGARFGFGGFVSATVLLVAGYLLDTFVIRRKRIHYRIQYNSKLGLIPTSIPDQHERSPEANPQIEQLTNVLERMSIVVIRFRNASGFDIDADQFETRPYVRFNKRIVWDARISDPTGEDLRQLIGDNLRFTENGDANNSAEPAEKLTGVRSLLRQRLARVLGLEELAPEIDTPPEWGDWHEVHLTRLSLKRKEKFKLLVVLQEPEGTLGGGITKDDIVVYGRIKNGVFTDERGIPRFTAPKISLVAGLLTASAAVATLMLSLIMVPAAPADPTVRCGSGSLNVVGSSAFMPILTEIAKGYTSSCHHAKILTEEHPSGSIEGIRTLNALPAAERSSMAALSDGQPTAEPTGGLVPHPVAVVVYGIIVNDSVGMDGLTLQQLEGIYSGQYRDWNQLRAGPSVPINLVSRGQESGSRQTLESQVLHHIEGDLTSNSCTKPDRAPDAPATRCERNTTSEVIQMVATTPGAIGYADIPSIDAAAASGQQLTAVKLDDVQPDVSHIPLGYPFWTVEYLYTKGTPDPGWLLSMFLGYLGNDSARATLQDAGYTPCIGKSGLLFSLCTGHDR